MIILLARIRDGLQNITIEEEVEDIISVPDVWARVQLLKMHYQIKIIHYIFKLKVNGGAY